MLIAVKHNIEVAHRLFESPGKCENIHGHSMWVTLFLRAPQDDKGMAGGLNFTNVKKDFRQILDEEYDHRLLLNEKDPFSAPHLAEEEDDVRIASLGELPGLKICAGDPTTENIAMWIGRFFRQEPYSYPVEACEVWETSVNMARWEEGRT